MRRNLFVRLLVLFLGVAVFSIAATAWITTQSTSERLRGQFERTLEADTHVYQQLLFYGQDHDSWDGVGTLVDDLAARTGNRVVLTGADGSLLADSAAGDGGAAALPSTPTAEVDPMAPLAVMASAVAGGSTPLDIEAWEGGEPADGDPPAFATTSPLAEDRFLLDGTASVTMVGTAGTLTAAPGWRLTDEEAAAREQLVADANACLQALGGDDLVVTPDGAVLRATAEEFSVTLEPPAHSIGGGGSAGGSGGGSVGGSVGGSAGDAGASAVDSVVNDCIPPELSAPSAASLAVNREQARLTEECLAGSGVATTQLWTTDGLIQPTVDAADPAALDLLSTCTAQASEQAMEPYLADPALLYIGSADRFDALSGDGWVRTVLTGLAVLAAATGVTVLAGRRLSHPIRTLTEAAQRMASGGRGARVRVTGHDEVARLGEAFNAMASSIEENERQRKAMVSDIAHELRTPLANVRGYLEAAEDGVVPLDPQLVSSLLEESALLQRLIDDLQDLALADAGMLRVHREETDVAELARQVVAAHQPSASASSVELDVVAPPAVTAEVDPVRLRQALGNLVANAVQYSGDGATVLVRVSHDAATGEIVLAVRDDGPGIAPEHLEHLFDRFYRTDTSRTRATGGSGLGLAITRHLVEAHDGTVTVASTVGAGSTFTIRLPVQAPAGAPASVG